MTESIMSSGMPPSSSSMSTRFGSITSARARLTIRVCTSFSSWGWASSKAWSTPNSSSSDKIFVSVLLIWITYYFDNIFILVSAILIISREISISYLRLFIVSLGKKVGEVKSDFSGKVKTTLQMIGIGFILITPITSEFIFYLSIVLILFSALISWYSLLKYLKKWIV